MACGRASRVYAVVFWAPRQPGAYLCANNNDHGLLHWGRCLPALLPDSRSFPFSFNPLLLLLLPRCWHVGNPGGRFPHANSLLSGC